MSTRAHRAALRLLAGAVVAALACSSEDQMLTPGLAPPDSVRATPLGLSSIRLDWSQEQGSNLENFVIQRRVDLQGSFEDLAEVTPDLTTFFDTGLKPATFYGYRVITLSRSGERSEGSVVAGARTAPMPGINYSTSLSGGTTTAIADPNGYQLKIHGPSSRSLRIGTLGQGTVSPLKPGNYVVTLSDILPTCTISDDTVRHITVVDTGLTTQIPVSFSAVCVDPNKGDVVAQVVVNGDSVDPNGYRVDYAGIIPGNPTPVLGSSTIAGIGGSHPFSALTPGDYEFTINDIDLPCAAGGATTFDVQVSPLSKDTVVFPVTCPDKGGGNPNAPLVFQNLWNPQTAGQGQSVNLDVILDLTGKPGQDIGVVQAELSYDPAILTYVSASSPSPTQMGGLTVNSATPGTLTWLNFSSAATPPTGVVPAARFTFQVTGTSGTRVITRSQIQLTADFNGAETLDTLFRVVEDTFTVGTGGGGNQSPTAQAGGPYSGTTAGAISFSSTGSSDPDGTIASYLWAFGDGATSTAANPSHSYSSAGSFTATLTVTDNLGASGSDQASVTVTGGGGGNQPPVAQANGPYSGVAGSSISLSATGSSDPDGSIASYAWDFGDGNSGTGQSPTHSYAAAGSYTAILTVTDNLGASATDQATVTISGGTGGGKPFIWTATVGPFEAVTQTIPVAVTLDLSKNIGATPGPEALETWVVDSLKWDPAVIEYFSFNYGPGGGGSVNPTDAVGGCKCKLVFGGTQPSGNSSGVILIAVIRFRFVGASGTSTTTKTKLGNLLGTAATGGFNYQSRTKVQETSITVP